MKEEPFSFSLKSEDTSNANQLPEKEKSPFVFVTQDKLYPIIYQFARLCNLRKSKKEIKRLITSEQKNFNYPSLFEIYTCWAENNPDHEMVKNIKNIGPGPSSSKKFPPCTKKRNRAKVNCPVPSRPMKTDDFSCERRLVCEDAIPKKTNRTRREKNCSKNKYGKQSSPTSGSSRSSQSFQNPFKGISSNKDSFLTGDSSDSDSGDDSTDEDKMCNLPLKPNSIPYRPEPNEVTTEFDNSSSDSGCDVETLRRINDNIIKQNEALLDCPYKKAADLNPERGLDKLYYEERLKRMRQLLKEIEEAKEKAEAEAKKLHKDLKKVEETEESAQSMLRSAYTDNRKLKAKIHSIKEELRFQIQTNNEEIKRLNDQIIEAHKQHGVEEHNKRENIPVLLEKIRTEYENVKNPI